MGESFCHQPALLSPEKIQLRPFQLQPGGGVEVYDERLQSVAPQLLLQTATPSLPQNHWPDALLVMTSFFFLITF